MNLLTTKLYPSITAAALLITLTACSDSDFDFEGSKDALTAEIAQRNPPQALFSPDPSAPVLPFPNNLFFADSDDGTLNLPLAPGDDETLANPRVALNQMDGFSTTSPISTTVSESLNPESLLVGTTIRVFEVTTAPVSNLAVAAVNGEITDPRLLAATQVGDQLVLIPTVPLRPKTDYLVVLTSGITDQDDNPLQASLLYGLLKGDQALTDPQLEGLRQTTGTHVVAAAGAGIDAQDIALSWVFRTQSTSDVLQTVKDQSVASTLRLANSGANTAAEGIMLFGKADIYVGELSVPYYQTAVGEDGNPLPALNGFWQNLNGDVVGTLNEAGVPDYAPVATGDQLIPVIMSVPNASSAGGGQMPADGWPVSIFQHGITGNRTQMLALADAMADAGRVLIAIDMPLHGLVDDSIPFHSNNTPFNTRERTFDIDVAVNPLAAGETPAAGAPTSGPDGNIDPSGQHFYNLANLANSRDNLRQAVADLFVLSASLASAQVEGLSLNASNLTFVGHSLGGIVGTTMLAFDNSFQAATLAMPGGGIARLLANSEAFGPTINAGLAAVGIEPGSAQFNAFLTTAQTLVDSGDPINHAATVVSNGTTRLHLIEVIGDAVIPNSVATAPLSGTEPLTRLLALPPVTQTSTTGGAVRFIEGDHASIIRPTASAAATAEMQMQTAGFALSQGAQLPVTNTSVIRTAQ